MILKILLVVGVIAVVYFIFIKKPQVQSQEREAKDAKKKDELQSSDMIECSECKVYCSLEDSLLSNGKYYCSKECMEKMK